MSDTELDIQTYELIKRWQGGLSDEDKKELEKLRAKARREAAAEKAQKRKRR